MRNIKKIAAVLSTALILCALASCGNPAGEPSDAPSPESSAVSSAASVSSVVSESPPSQPAEESSQPEESKAVEENPTEESILTELVGGSYKGDEYRIVGDFSAYDHIVAKKTSDGELLGIVDSDGKLFVDFRYGRIYEGDGNLIIAKEHESIGDGVDILKLSYENGKKNVETAVPRGTYAQTGISSIFAASLEQGSYVFDLDCHNLYKRADGSYEIFGNEWLYMGPEGTREDITLSVNLSGIVSVETAGYYNGCYYAATADGKHYAVWSDGSYYLRFAECPDISAFTAEYTAVMADTSKKLLEAAIASDGEAIRTLTGEAFYAEYMTPGTAVNRTLTRIPEIFAKKEYAITYSPNGFSDIGNKKLNPQPGGFTVFTAWCNDVEANYPTARILFLLRIDSDGVARVYGVAFDVEV